MATVTKLDLAAIDRQALAAVCQRFNVTRLQLFGSALRGEMEEGSDVDLLYDLKEGSKMSLFDLVDLGDALSPLFSGRYVDLGRPQQLHWYIRDEVLNAAKTIFEA